MKIRLKGDLGLELQRLGLQSGDVIPERCISTGIAPFELRASFGRRITILLTIKK